MLAPVRGSCMKSRSQLIALSPIQAILLLASLVAAFSPPAWAQNATVVQLVSAPNPAVQGQPVTFSAFVSSAGNPNPTGAVIFSDGTAPLATIPLDTTGAAIWTTSALSVGVHTITASYGG